MGIRKGDSRDLTVHGGSFVGADFSGRHLEHFSPEGTRFEHCRFDGIVIDSASFGSGLRDSTYLDCSFDGARLRMFSVGYARLERCSLKNVRIDNFHCLGLELIDCTVSGKIDGGWLSGTVPAESAETLGRSRNEIKGNDFSGVRFIDFGFRAGVDLRDQLLPDGPDYVYIDDFPASVGRARKAMLSENDLKLRRDAFVFLGLWDGIVQGGQQQMLLREKDYPVSSRPAFRRLVELMGD